MVRLVDIFLDAIAMTILVAPQCMSSRGTAGRVQNSMGRSPQMGTKFGKEIADNSFISSHGR
ncbi:MAG: hypothetical protein K0R08_422 [Solimicrobium sp.]|jgi:hypothetical protein|nr:hypothetical protein [Solimicrobium sp.]